MSYTAPHDWSAGELVTATNLDNLSTCITELQTETPQGTIAILNTFAATAESTPDDAGPTSGTTALNVSTVSIAAPGVNGFILAGGQVTFTKSSSSDLYVVSLIVEGTVVGRAPELNAGTYTAMTLRVGGGVAYATAGGAISVTTQLTRTSGSGTATVSSTVGNTSLWALFIPTV